LDAALLDVRINGRDVYAVADVLMRRRIPFVFKWATPIRRCSTEAEGRTPFGTHYCAAR
jgi:hypothetical protein